MQLYLQHEYFTVPSSLPVLPLFVHVGKGFTSALSHFPAILKNSGMGQAGSHQRF